MSSHREAMKAHLVRGILRSGSFAHVCPIDQVVETANDIAEEILTTEIEHLADGLWRLR